MSEEEDRRRRAQTGQYHTGSGVDDSECCDFLIERKHKNFKRYTHGSDDHEEQEALQFELVHGKTIRDKVAYKKSQDYCQQGQDQGVLVPHKVLRGVNLAVRAEESEQILIVVKRHGREIPVDRQTVLHQLTARSERCQQACQERERDQKADDREKPGRQDRSNPMV